MLNAHLSTTTQGLDHISVIEEEGSWQGDTVRMVGGAVLQGDIQSLR